MIDYLLKAMLGLTIVYFFYRHWLYNGHDFTFNRYYLVLGPLIALFLPLLKLSVNEANPISYIVLPEIQISASSAIIQPDIDKESSYMNFVLPVYILVSASLLARLLFQLARIFRLKAGSKKDKYGNFVVNDSTPTFSFFHWLFLNAEDYSDNLEKEHIIQHEQMHISKKHSIDVLVIEILQVLLWWFPLIWLYKPLMIENHEFEVDSRAVKEHNKARYTQLLAKNAVRSSGLILSHKFNQCSILKRLRMLTNKVAKRSVKITALGTSMFLVFTFIILACSEDGSTSSEVTDNIIRHENGVRPDISSEEVATFDVRKLENGLAEWKITLKNGEVHVYTVEDGQELPKDYLSEDPKDDVFTVVENAPMPKGGMDPFYQYISQNLKYPEEAKSAGIEGRVFVEFIVDKEGNLTDVRTVKGIGHGCDVEAIRVIENAPEWIPGTQRGKNVNVKMILPITFKLD